MADQQDITQEVMTPCPFCGEGEDLHSYESVPCLCGNCGATAGSFGKSRSVQIEIWNTRAVNEENKRLHAELLEIHTIAQCVGCDHVIKDTDPLTVKAVKGMAQRIRVFEEYRAALDDVVSAGIDPLLDDKQAADKMYEIAEQALEEK